MHSYFAAIKTANLAGHLSMRLITMATASYRCHYSEVVGRCLFVVQLPGASIAHDRVTLLSCVTLVNHERSELVGLLLGPVHQLIVDPGTVRQVRTATERCQKARKKYIHKLFGYVVNLL